MHLAHCLIPALLATSTLAQMIIGTAIFGNYTKEDVVEPTTRLSARMTNAERLKLGMQPKFPRKLERVMERRAKKGRSESTRELS